MAVQRPSARQRREQVQAQASEFGRARELGECRGIYQTPGGGGCATIMIVGGILVGMSFAAAAYSQIPAAGVVLFIIAGAVVVAGVVRSRMPRRDKRNSVFLYSGGAAQFIAGESTPRVIPWGILGHVFKEYGLSGDADVPPLEKLRITAADGTEITASRKYSNLAGLAIQIDRLLVTTRLPAALEQLSSGSAVILGPLSVSAHDITLPRQAEFVAWHDVRSIRIEPHQIWVAAHHQPFGRRIDCDVVPDWAVAVRLIQELASRNGIKVRGAVDASPGPGG
jgi:hypothetical protein